MARYNHTNDDTDILAPQLENQMGDFTHQSWPRPAEKPAFGQKRAQERGGFSQAAPLYQAQGAVSPTMAICRLETYVYK